MTYLAWRADGVRDIALIAYLVVIILSSLLLGWRVASVMGGLSIVAIWYFGIMLESIDTPILDMINRKTTKIVNHEKVIMNCETRVFSSSTKIGDANKRRSQLDMVAIIYHVYIK